MKTHAKTHGLRRFLCGLTALAMAALMVPMSAMAVDKNKTATDLVNDQTTVTLSIGKNSSTSTVTNAADVVFVLDKSTSIEVKNQALAMLSELQDHSETNNVKIQVGVVTFNNNANNTEFNLDLTDLNDESYSKIQNIFSKNLSDGTNIEAGIRKGMKMLASDNETSDSYKHLVLVTDGVTYLWGENAVNTIYVGYQHHDGQYLIWNSNSLASGITDKSKLKITDSTYVSSFADPDQWISDNENGIEATLQEYEVSWGDTSKYIDTESLKENESVYTAQDIAVYKAGKAWQEANQRGYHLYSYVSNLYWNDGITTNREGDYPWAANFFSNLYQIGGDSFMFTDTDTGVANMFDEVKSEIISQTTNEIQSGTVTDYIGQYFNLANLNNGNLTNSTFTLKVGGTVIPVTSISEDGKTVYFGTNYSVTYYPSTEYFVWNINTPVTTDLELSYVLNLDRNLVESNPPSDPDKVPTNGDTTLEYKDPDGNEHEEPFTPPTVSVDVGGGDDEDPDEPENPPIVIPDNPSLTIRKIWENDSASDRPDSITVDIYHDGEYYDSMVISGLRFGNSDTWRDSYDIPARYEDDDWWVVESDVPAYYDSDVEEIRENVFYITNTYEEPVIEEPVSSEPESSEPSSEPSEVIPSEPSVEPSSEPASEPSEPAEPTLPQTGQTWWPIIILLAGGAVLVAFGAFRTIRGNGRRER